MLRSCSPLDMEQTSQVKQCNLGAPIITVLMTSSSSDLAIFISKQCSEMSNENVNKVPKV